MYLKLLQWSEQVCMQEKTYKFFLMKDSISALSADPSNTTEEGSNLFSRCFGRKSTTTSLYPYFSLTVASRECAKRMDSLSLSAAFRKASEIYSMFQGNTGFIGQLLETENHFKRLYCLIIFPYYRNSKTKWITCTEIKAKDFSTTAYCTLQKSYQSETGLFGRLLL